MRILYLTRQDIKGNLALNHFLRAGLKSLMSKMPDDPVQNTPLKTLQTFTDGVHDSDHFGF